VNIREQCSWAHTDDHEGATRKAARLVKAGVGRTRLTVPLDPIVVETIPKRSWSAGHRRPARRARPGRDRTGRVPCGARGPARGLDTRFGDMYPNGKNGGDLISRLEKKVREHPGITVFTEAQVVEKSGSFGNYEVSIRVGGAKPRPSRSGGSLVVASGFEAYPVKEGEFGRAWTAWSPCPNSKVVGRRRRAAEVSGQARPDRGLHLLRGQQADRRRRASNEYCSRYCCTAAVHSSLQVAAKVGRVHQYHLHRDVRTYGKYELLYDEALSQGAVFVKVPDDEPPAVNRDPESGKLLVTTRDLLSEGEEVEIPADLVVLVTGMVARDNEVLTKTLKLP